MQIYFSLYYKILLCHYLVCIALVMISKKIEFFPKDDKDINARIARNILLYDERRDEHIIQNLKRQLQIYTVISNKLQEHWHTNFTYQRQRSFNEQSHISHHVKLVKTIRILVFTRPVCSFAIIFEKSRMLSYD